MKAKYWKAVNLALHDAMAEDESVVVIGQDVAVPGGPFGMTRRLLNDFGPLRTRDTPISEAAMMGCATGAAMAGLRPVVEIMFVDFLPLAMNQLVNQAAKFRYYAGERSQLPLVVTSLYGGRRSGGAQHSQSYEAWLGHVPGLKVAFPWSVADAYGVLRVAIEDPDPTVVILAVNALTEDGELDTEQFDVEWFAPGTGRQVVNGDRVTVVSYGPALPLCEQAIADTGVSADLIDLRWLQPWPVELVAASLRRTGKLMVVHDAAVQGGWGAEIVATLTGTTFWQLDAPPVRIGADFTPMPAPSREWRSLLPDAARIAAALKELDAA